MAASEDTAASGSEVKSDLDVPQDKKLANSTKREGEKSLSDALKDIAFTNKTGTHGGNHDAQGFHNDTVHIYLNKDGKVHNTTNHKQFLDNHKSKKVKSTTKASALENKNKKNVSHVDAVKDAQLKKDASK